MVKNLTYEFVKGEIENQGYILVSSQYVNSYTKLEIKCLDGHMFKMAWSEWKKGQRCRYCMHDSLRLSIEFVKSEFEKENYKLMAAKYINSSQKLEYVCPKGHLGTITWGNWKSGHRCSVCANNTRKTVEFIKSEFYKEGYKLLTTKYTNNRQKLRYICKEGHISLITWNDWKSGCRCSMCKAINMYGEGNHEWKGGISFGGYCPIWKDKIYKKDILKRDNYRCQNSDCWGKKGNAAQLMPHHIDYDKENCHPSNLITLCRSCNARANKNRKQWQKLYKRCNERRKIV